VQYFSLFSSFIMVRAPYEPFRGSAIRTPRKMRTISSFFFCAITVRPRVRRGSRANFGRPSITVGSRLFLFGRSPAFGKVAQWSSEMKGHVVRFIVFDPERSCLNGMTKSPGTLPFHSGTQIQRPKFAGTAFPSSLCHIIAFDFSFN